MASFESLNTPEQPSLFPELPPAAKPYWHFRLHERPRRIDALLEQLPTVLSLSETRRLDLIEQDVVADYLALRWLEWHHGRLELTPTGRHARNAAG